MKRIYLIATVAAAFFLSGCGAMNSLKSFAFKEVGDYHYEKKSYRKAFNAYKDAAEKGSGYAYYRLHTIYEYGQGVPKDVKLAGAMLEEAARLGYGRAEVIVANRLLFTSKNRDTARGMRLLLSAASKEIPEAYADLYTVYYYGIGVSRDRGKAREYRRLAAANGFVIPAPAQVRRVVATGGMVESVQQSLKQMGFYRGKVDGLTGPMTRRAIETFQRFYGYPVDTRISYLLLEQIGREIY